MRIQYSTPSQKKQTFLQKIMHIFLFLQDLRFSPRSQTLQSEISQKPGGVHFVPLPVCLGGYLAVSACLSSLNAALNSASSVESNPATNGISDISVQVVLSSSESA